jgi:hypothetical protein
MIYIFYKRNKKIGIDGFAWEMKKRLKLEGGRDRLVLVHHMDDHNPGDGHSYGGLRQFEQFVHRQ